MKIDIDKLTESELIDLNHRVVERLRLLNQMHAHVEMLEFKIGDRVVFQAGHRGLVEGMLTRYNYRRRASLERIARIFTEGGIPRKTGDEQGRAAFWAMIHFRRRPQATFAGAPRCGVQQNRCVHF